MKVVEKVSWMGLEKLCEKLIVNIEKPDVIIATGDGGCVVGRLLRSTWQVPLAFFSCTEEDGHVKSSWRLAYDEEIHYGSRILIVDGANYKGKFLRETSKQVRLRFPDSEIETAVLHNNSKSGFNPNYYAKRIAPNVRIEYPYQQGLIH